MKKQYSILSVMFVLALSFVLTSCGAKKDEALVTDFNAKKTEADKMISSMNDNGKMMMSDHAAWTAKLDSAAKLPKADTAKIAGFKAQMKKMEDMTAANALMDSLKLYSNAKVDNNDQLKSAIAGLSANLAAGTSMTTSMMDAHKKLGADITAFLGGAAPAAGAKEEAAEAKKGGSAKAKTPAAPPSAPKMDMTKHPVKPGSSGTPR
ncbi:MAG: hypothetical protein Q8916_04745 [Bacteroidota bacterium]|nr:hypothetical protein [Bacteroidota bacterium]MDP4229695.1 hypothetical protein [Bacteroidota bacterium]MDP4235069.1 hypothetical protein [Bacteroidota bacterium]